MPTPFMHLRTAELMRDHARLDPSVQHWLADDWPAFLLGSIAPDFQTIFDVPRERTHLYGLPPRSAEPPHEKMLSRYPLLADSQQLPVAQSMFVAGYLAHLLLDWRWYHQVLIPYFVRTDGWTSRRDRFMVHAVLLTYLDSEALAQISAELVAGLEAARPDAWLPFAESAQIEGWQRYVSQQLGPGNGVRTTAIFAGRLGLAEEEFAAYLADQDWMATHLFSRVPVETVRADLCRAIDDSVVLLNDYLVETD